MKYTIAVSASPQHQGSHTALQFAHALLAKGHEIERIFFFQDGVLNCNRLSVTPQDEASPYEGWVQLAKDNKTEMIACVSAALRRGIVDAKEAERYELEHHSLEAPFTIGGLGQLVDGMLCSDRFIHFGA